MKSNRIIIFVLIAIFFAVTVCAFFAVFTVKQVRVEFSSSFKTDDAEELSASLQKYVGSNMFFIKYDSFIEDVEKYPYLELEGIKKEYPNVISVCVRERQEIYLFDHDDKTFVFTADGFVLSDGEAADDEGRLIRLSFEGDITVKKVQVGECLSTDADNDLATAFELVKNVRLTDCIKNMTVIKNIEQTDVVFDTYTNVKIRIPKIDADGVNKVIKAFEFYDNEKSDFIKSSNEIRVDLLQNGTLRVAWVSNDGE